MKASEIRMCDGCKGPLLKDQCITFYKLRVSMCIPDAAALRRRSAMDVMFPGAPRLAVAMTGDEDLVKVAGEESEAMWTDLLLCFECYAMKTGLAQIVEQRERELEAAATAPQGNA